MKKMINFVKEFDLFIIAAWALIVMTCIMLSTPMKANDEVEHVITDEEIALFAVEHDQNYEGIVEVRIDNVGYNERWDCDTIDFHIYVDGELKAYRGINRDWYLDMLEKSRENS